MPTRAKSGLQLIRADALTRLPWVRHAFTTRSGGVSEAYGGHALNLGYTKHDTHAAVDANRAALLKSIGGSDWHLVRLRQVHSDVIHRVERAPEQLLSGDGLVTDAPGLLLAVQTADCIPVLVVDAKRKAVGAFHAGWRGTAARMVEKGVGAMRMHFGSDPRDLHAAIGPGIGPCCYSVGEEVRDRFHAQFAYAADLFRQVNESDPVHERYPLLFLTSRAPGHSDVWRVLYLDLKEANRRQLLDAAVPEGNISVLNYCTSCRKDLFFSHRGQRGLTGRQMAVVGICNL